ncbi:MAG TPA: zinc-ribbon domain-containing protein [Pyrinomonadaceae bacterium]|nr:zinc-ribbon domain-containing protein [Pyrinomonadaceae bacterium]
MLVICSNCKARLQLDESKIPSHSFKLRCPKCQGRIEIKSAVPSDNDSSGITFPEEMTPPVTQDSPFERPPVAAPFKPNGSDAVADTATASSDDIVKLLAQVLRHADSGASKSGAVKRPAWSRRKALVCVEAELSGEIASGLVASDYEVFVAENTAEALGRMREDRIDVVVLDGNFDPVEQGFAFVTREVKLLQPSERRRLFLVYMTPNARTLDLHAAFLHNANLVVNPTDVGRLPEALDVSLRYYNDLYRELNRVLELAPI